MRKKVGRYRFQANPPVQGFRDRRTPTKPPILPLCFYKKRARCRAKMATYHALGRPWLSEARFFGSKGQSIDNEFPGRCRATPTPLYEVGVPESGY